MSRTSSIHIDVSLIGFFASGQLLNRQVAAVNFVPLKEYFLAAYQTSHVHVPANPSLPPLEFNVRRNPEVAEVRDALPAVPFTLADLKEAELADGLKAFTRGKFVESLAAFRTVLQKAMLIAVQTDAEAIEVSLRSR